MRKQYLVNIVVLCGMFFSLHVLAMKKNEDVLEREEDPKEKIRQQKNTLEVLKNVNNGLYEEYMLLDPSLFDDYINNLKYCSKRNSDSMNELRNYFKSNNAIIGEKQCHFLDVILRYYADGIIYCICVNDEINMKIKIASAISFIENMKINIIEYLKTADYDQESYINAICNADSINKKNEIFDDAVGKFELAFKKTR